MTAGDDTPRRACYESVCKRLAVTVTDRRRAELDDELRTIAERLRAGDDVRPGDVERARRRMNELRRLLEDELAPLAGVESWGAPPPQVPVGAIREHYGAIRPADEVDSDD